MNCQDVGQTTMALGHCDHPQQRAQQNQQHQQPHQQHRQQHNVVSFRGNSSLARGAMMHHEKKSLTSPTAPEIERGYGTNPPLPPHHRARALRRNGFYHAHLLQSAVMASISTNSILSEEDEDTNMSNMMNDMSMRVDRYDDVREVSQSSSEDNSILSVTSDEDLPSQQPVAIAPMLNIQQHSIATRRSSAPTTSSSSSPQMVSKRSVQPSSYFTLMEDCSRIETDVYDGILTSPTSAPAAPVAPSPEDEDGCPPPPAPPMMEMNFDISPRRVASRRGKKDTPSSPSMNFGRKHIL